MYIKSKKYIIIVAACIIASSGAINTRCHHSVTEQRLLNHLCRLTRMTGWQELSEVKNNVEFWKIQLKKKIATYDSNGLTPSTDAYVNAIQGLQMGSLFIGAIASGLSLGAIFATVLPYSNTERIRDIQEAVTIAGASVVCTLLSWEATEHAYCDSKRKLKKYKSILRQLEAIKA